MAAALTPLQSLDGQIVLAEPCDGWQIEEVGADVALGEPVAIPAGTYEARGRLTTARPGSGGFAREVYLFALDEGSLRAVGTAAAKFEP